MKNDSNEVYEENISFYVNSVFDDPVPDELLYYYFNIISNCKDICDSINKVNNIGRCELLKTQFSYMNEEKNEINADVLLYLGEHGKGEGRHIKSEIYLEENRIVVSMKVTRLCKECDNKEYYVQDVFTKKADKIERETTYSYKEDKIVEEIENEEMKGKLK